MLIIVVILVILVIVTIIIIIIIIVVVVVVVVQRLGELFGLEGTEGVPRSGGRKWQLVWSYLCTLNDVYVQTLMSTDVQTPLPWDPLSSPLVRITCQTSRLAIFYPFQPTLWSSFFPSKPVKKTAQSSPKPISEGGRIGRVRQANTKGCATYIYIYIYIYTNYIHIYIYIYIKGKVCCWAVCHWTCARQTACRTPISLAMSRTTVRSVVYIHMSMYVYIYIYIYICY